jgi:hypothetical protein
MNSLTIRKLPIFTARSGSGHKVRMDRALADMVNASVQMKYPSVRCGKRYSIEYALMQYLYSQGLISREPSVPIFATEVHGDHE